MDSTQEMCDKCTALAQFHTSFAVKRKWVEHLKLCNDHYEAIFRDCFRNKRQNDDRESITPVRFDVEILSARSDNSDALCYLIEEGGSRRFWTRLTYCEAASLFWNLGPSKNAQPRTHQLLANTISSIGANLQAVIIDEEKMAESEFSGILKLAHGDDSVAVDARPGDAINLAVLCHAPIWITPKALAKRPGT